MTTIPELLERLDRDMTPGRWFHDSYSRLISRDEARSAVDPDDWFVDVAWCPVKCGDTGTDQGRADLKALAALRNALPELAAYVRALEGRLDVVRSNAGMCVYSQDEEFRAGSAEAFNQAAEQADSEELDSARAALAAKLNEGSTRED